MGRGKERYPEVMPGDPSESLWAGTGRVPPGMQSGRSGGTAGMQSGRSGGTAVEQLLGELAELHARVLTVSQHRVDARARPADRRDPVHGVLAGEERERARAGEQPRNAFRVAV